MKHVLPWLAGWLAFFWLWQLLAGEWNHIEWIAGAAAATVAATLGELARSAGRLRMPLDAAWIARLWSIPVAVVADFAILMWALPRRRRGEWVRRPLPADVSGDPSACAALALAATYSPNAYVVDVDEGEGIVLLHDLVRHRASESPV